jgi:Uncharacterized conserved protein (DUF2183)
MHCGDLSPRRQIIAGIAPGFPARRDHVSFTDMDIRKTTSKGSNFGHCIATGESVIFFPTAAHFSQGAWHIPIHGWIYRPAELSRLRKVGLWLARRFASRRAKMDADEMKLFRQRAASFLADNNRRRRVQIQLGNSIFKMPRSRANGHFQSIITLPDGDVKKIASPPPHGSGPSLLNFQPVTSAGDERRFAGQVILLPEQGFSVISDIDDTIKITEVTNRRKMLRHTFLEDFACVPEMVALYRHWQQTRNAAFHYVSASPWHLYPFLAEFLQAQQFPQGTLHLRDFRLMPGDLHRTLRPSRRIKLAHARGLMRRFPLRRFILVGDSGESDPQIYAQLFAQHPDQIERICIRCVAPGDECTCERALKGIPPARRSIFKDPAELTDCALKK